MARTLKRKTKKGQRPVRVKGKAGVGPGPNWPLWIGWTLVLLAFFSLSNFSFLLFPSYPFRNVPFLPLMVLGSAGILWGWRARPEGKAQGDPGRLWAWIFFALFLGLAFFLRMFDAGQLPARAWDDQYAVFADIRRLMDYQDRPMIFPYGYRTPFFPYLGALVWAPMSDVPGALAVRTAATLMDLFLVWILYLLGKEMGGRRMGLILMFFGAISKIALQTTKYDLGTNEVFLGCALILLFLYRVLRKPSLSRFLQLGAALGFGDYTYTPVRVWIPLVIFGVLGWFLWEPRTRPKKPAAWGLAAGVGIFWAAFFLYKTTSLPQWLPFLHFFMEGMGAWLVAGVLGWGLWVNRKGGIVRDWAAGSLLAALIILPLWVQPLYGMHSSELAVWCPRYNFTFTQVLHSIWDSFWGSFPFMFGPNGGDLAVPFLESNCMMDYFAPLFGVLGLGLILVRPRPIRWVLPLFFLAGMVPVLLSPGILWPHLLGCVVPLWTLAALGAGRLWGTMEESWPARKAWIALGFVLVGAWFLAKDFRWIRNLESQRAGDLLAAGVLDQDRGLHRAYLMPYQDQFVLATRDLISEGRTVYRGNASNPVQEGPGESKDLLVLTWVGDHADQERIQKEFPGALWSETKDWQGIIILRNAIIPAGDLSADPKALFYRPAGPRAPWSRRYYGPYGIARGIIHEEERVVHWNDHPSSEAQGNNTVKVLGNWSVPTSGAYVLSVKTPNFLRFFVDGREVLCVRRGEGNLEKTRTLDLGAGPHKIELRAAFIQDIQVPVIMVRLPDGKVQALEDMGSAD